MIWACAVSDEEQTRYSIIMGTFSLKSASLPVWTVLIIFLLFVSLKTFLKISVKTSKPQVFGSSGFDSWFYQKRDYIKKKGILWQGIDYRLKILRENRSAFL